MKALIFTKKGDRYDEEALRRDFMALWNTGRFDDIKLEREQGNAGWIVRFVLTERRVIRSIKYEGMKSLTVSEILDRFKERKVGLTVESQYDPNKVQRAATVLKEFLAADAERFDAIKKSSSFHSDHRKVSIADAGWVWGEGQKVDLADLRKRLAEITLAFDKQGNPVTTADLDVAGAGDEREVQSREEAAPFRDVVRRRAEPLRIREARGRPDPVGRGSRIPPRRPVEIEDEAPFAPHGIQ